MAAAPGLGSDHDRIAQLVSHTTEFIRTVAIPAENHLTRTSHPSDELRSRLQAGARARGLLAPTAAVELGGLGLRLPEQAPVLEAAGYSLLGPLALNCAAPDEGNIHLLTRLCTAEQRERYLLPLVSGASRSAFAMTEPAPGAGSDPSMLMTTARRAPGGWVIDGTKRFITGADGAAFLIVMATTAEGATLFLVDAGSPGLEIGRRIGTTDRAFVGGHAELTFDGCRVPDDAVLGTVGAAFDHAQIRLAPARLTHCMRHLGLAQRAQDVALEYLLHRTSGGSRLADLGLVHQLLADNEIDLVSSRALVHRAARELDAGRPARHETSIAKTFVAEAVHRVVDRATQLCGGSGVSDDLILSTIAGEVRPFRIYDGPSEAHRGAIARRVVRRFEATRAAA